MRTYLCGENLWFGGRELDQRRRNDCHAQWDRTSKARWAALRWLASTTGHGLFAQDRRRVLFIDEPTDGSIQVPARAVGLFSEFAVKAMKLLADDPLHG